MEQKYRFDKASVLSSKGIDSIVLVSLKVKLIGNGVTLVTWEVERHDDSLVYLLECSRDSLNWKKLHDSFKQEKHVLVKDTDLQPGNNYYRIVSIADNDETKVLGLSVYYAENSEEGISYVETFVNEDKQILRINSSKMITYIELLDTREHVLFRSNVPKLNKVKTSLRDLEEGEYYLHIYMGESWERKKIFVQ